MTRGQRLLTLRRERWTSGARVDGKRASQATLAYMADIDPRTLRDLEAGRTTPKYATLVALLDALGEFAPIRAETKKAIFAEYQLKPVALTDSIDLPNAEEVQQAVASWLDTYPFHFPALLTDISQNILTWNRYFPRAFGLTEGDPRMAAFKGISVFDLAFRIVPLYVELTNRDAYLLGFLRGLKYTFWPHRHEAWCQAQIARARSYPACRAIWDALPEEPPPFPTYENTEPINLRIKATGLQLSFGMLTVRFRSDLRFRINQFIPLDARTHLQCQIWAQEPG